MIRLLLIFALAFTVTGAALATRDHNASCQEYKAKHAKCGSPTPTVAPTPTATPSGTTSPTPSPSPTVVPTATPEPEATPVVPETVVLPAVLPSVGGSGK